MCCHEVMRRSELDAGDVGFEKGGHLCGGLFWRPGEGKPVQGGVRYEPGGLVVVARAGQRLHGAGSRFRHAQNQVTRAV